MAKRKVILKSCGFCHMCGKEHMSNEGGWVINAEKLNFCHSLEHSCYEIYFNNVDSNPSSLSANSSISLTIKSGSLPVKPITSIPYGLVLS